MEILKAIIHILLACTFWITLTSANITREFQMTTYNPYTVSINSDIYTISLDAKNVYVFSSDLNYKMCIIEIDPSRDIINGRMKATAIGTKKIILYGINRHTDEHTVRSVYHTFLLIDPFRCELKRLLDVPHDKTPIFFPITNAHIVARSNQKFDIFYLGPSECSPCRYDTEGKQTKLNKQVKSDFSMLTNFHVEPLKRSGGYAYAVSYNDGSTGLQMLNTDFKLINQLKLNNTLFDMSTTLRGTTSFIGIIYNSASSPYEFYYTLYNFTLCVLFKKRLPSLGSQYLGLGALVKMDSRGNSYIVFQQMLSEQGNVVVSLIAYDVNGQSIGHLNEFAKPSTGFYEMQALLVEDREYCLVIHEFYEVNSVTNIKCIDITKKI